MNASKKFGDKFSFLFDGLQNDLITKIKEGHIKEEDHITSTLFSLMEERVNTYAERDIATQDGDNFKITARQFTGRGRNSEESRIGADGALGLRLSIGDLEVQKFFIFQAKKFSAKSKFDARAVQQRQRMLDCSPDSFFLVYTSTDIYWVSAFLVGEGDTIVDLPSKGLVEFCQDFFNCFIGDHFFGFPDSPYRYPWRYGPSDDYPAKKNLVISISDK